MTTDDCQKPHDKLSVATPVGCASTLTDYTTHVNITNTLPMKARSLTTVAGETAELSNTVSTQSCKNSIDNIREQQTAPCIEENDPNLTVTNSNELDAATIKPKNLKCYNIDKSIPAEPNQELPDIPLASTAEILPGATTTSLETDLVDTLSPSDITLPDDDLPLLAQNELLGDFETLLSLDNDYDNTNLMPVGGAPTLDIIKEINNKAGVNQDLEIAMENARFLDENLLAQSTTDSPNKTNQASEKIPVSLRGRFRTKTHGIKKLTPEERKDKKFKCEDCEFIAYSRRGVSEHYTEKHGSCICEYCDRYFTNPHALKRHQYDHSSDKRYQCKDCDQIFYFHSELTAHRMKHQENPSFPCMANGCGKIFFRNSDLNAHVPVHSGILHRCDHTGCTYSNLDKRLVTGHKRVHSDKKTFKCKYEGCDESFKHTNARLRHYKQDH